MTLFPPKQFAVNKPLFPFWPTQWGQNSSMSSTFPERPFAASFSNSWCCSIHWQLTANQMTKKHIPSCSQGSFLEEAAVIVRTNLAAVTSCHPHKGFVSLESRTTGSLALAVLCREGQVFSHEVPHVSFSSSHHSPDSAEWVWVRQVSTRAPHLEHRPGQALANLL